MKRLSGVCFCGVFFATGCSRDPVFASSKSTAGVATPTTAPTAATATPSSDTPSPAAPVDQTKLKGELEALGVEVNRWGEVSVAAAALTAGGDFKPGVAAKLVQLESVTVVNALDLPAFGVGAAKAVAAIPGLRRVTLWRTNATEDAVAALGDCPTLETADLNIGSEFPVVTDAGLTGLAKLKSLKTLTCQRGKITAAGLKALDGSTTLVELNLTGCPLDDSAAPHLAKLTNLTMLNVSVTKLTGKGLAAVAAGATKLTILGADGTGVTDADLPAFAALPGLTHLSLGGTAVSDVGMAALAKSKSLTSLTLHDTKVTDTGVVSLAGLPKLQFLTLYRLGLTDVSLVALAEAPQLLTLSASGNKFTAAGLAKFAAARPKVSVDK